MRREDECLTRVQLTIDKSSELLINIRCKMSLSLKFIAEEALHLFGES